MDQTSKNFYRNLTFLTTLVLVLYVILISVLPSGFIPKAIPYFVLLFPLTSALLYFVLNKVKYKSATAFQSAYFGLSIGRFFIYLAIIITYIYFFRENSKSFIINFFILYIIYFFFDIRVTLRQSGIKNTKKK